MPEVLESGCPEEPLAASTPPTPEVGWCNLSLQSVPPSLSCPLQKAPTGYSHSTGSRLTLPDFASRRQVELPRPTILGLRSPHIGNLAGCPQLRELLSPGSRRKVLGRQRSPGETANVRTLTEATYWQTKCLIIGRDKGVICYF
jgi:hypothetical protein